MELHAAGPRRFAALVPHLAPGRMHVLVRRGDTSRRVTLLVPPRTTGREHRAVGPNDALLARVTAATGGRVSPTPAEVIAAAPGSAHATWALSILLIPLALALTLGDIALRL
jgi:hypothetical protein